MKDFSFVLTAVESPVAFTPRLKLRLLYIWLRDMFGRLSGEKAALMLFGCGTFEKLDALLLLEMPLDA